MLLHRRRLLGALAAAPLGCSLFGGRKTNAGNGAPPDRGYEMAWAAAASGHGASDGLFTAWTQVMWQIKHDAVPFLRALRAAPARRKPHVGIAFEEVYGAIGAHWIVLDEHNEPTDVRDDAAVQAVVSATRQNADDMRIAAHALSWVAQVIASFAEHAKSRRDEVDKLLVNHEVWWPQAVAAGRMSQQEVDALEPDYQLALRIHARYHESLQATRADAMVVTVLASQFLQDGVIDELEPTADDAIAAGRVIQSFPDAEAFGIPDAAATAEFLEESAVRNAWLRVHPMVAEYPDGLKSKVPVVPQTLPHGNHPAAAVAAELEATGVRRRDGDFVASLPEAKGMLEDFRAMEAKVQKVAATADTAMTGANAAMSGDVGGTMQAAGKFLPPDHIAVASIDTFAAATRGDIRGVIAGLDRMTKNSKLRQRVRKRLARFEHLRPLVEAGVDVAKRVR